jgi:hypothetical protein
MSSKKASNLSSENIMRSAHVDETATLSINGYVSGKIGRKIALALATTNVADDTEVYTYSEDGTQIMVLTIIYSDATRSTMLSVERTA